MKTQLISIAKSITVFILLIFCAVVIDARAEDYLWEPTLAWEDPSPGIGHKLLNNDEWLIYYADNKVQLRELATGKKLAESEDLLQLLELTKCDAASFSMSNDGEKIYGIFTYYRDGPMVIFDSKTLKVIKRIKINNPGAFGTQYSLPDGSRFFILGSLSGYFVSSDDFRIVCETKYDYGNHWPSPGEPVKPNGTCIISFNPEATEHLFVENKDSYKMLFYNETQFKYMGLYRDSWLYQKNEEYHLLDLISMKDIHSNKQIFSVSPDRKYILQDSENDVLLLDYKSKSVVKKFDTNEILVDHQAQYYPTQIRLYFFSVYNSNLIFSDLLHWCTGGIFAMDLSSRKRYQLFSRDFYKSLCDNVYNEGMFSKITIFSTNHGDYLFRIGGKAYKIEGPTQLYKLSERSSVKDNTDKGIIVDTVNANIPIPNGKYPKYISIYTSDGKLVEEVKEITISNNYILYNIENLSNGIYIINIKFEDGSSQSFKFVKGK